MSNAWQKNGQPFSAADIGNNFGFVYQITDTQNGRMYIGKKFFWKEQKRAKRDSAGKTVKFKTGANAGKSRKVKERIPSDWEDYYSSNPTIAEIAKTTPERFVREILFLCSTRGECAYIEAKTQFDRDVLLDDRYYNEIINLRCNASAVKHLKKQVQNLQDRN